MEPRSAIPSAGTDDRPAGARPTILIVDDAVENLIALAGCLQPMYRVRAVKSGPAALQAALMASTPDLILLDVMMPDMDGYEVLRRLRLNPQTRDIPVIFVTAMDEAEAEEHGLEVGAVDYIAKPLRPAIVRARVRNQLELKRARDWLTDENAFLEAEVARRMRESQVIQEVSILALARVAEVRDPETGLHLRRTREYVRALATRLKHQPGFSMLADDRNIDLVAKSALLHDIGKVGIPDHILLKPGQLTPDEWEIMKTHAIIGARAIEQAERDAEHPVEFLVVAKEIAHYHHERWDGSGYPDGMSGDAIPIAARLMALADVFDAVISRRVYKPSLSLAEARQVILGGRGTHFDPRTVDAFTTIYDQFVNIAERYRD